jgi:hypothetical protein
VSEYIYLWRELIAQGYLEPSELAPPLASSDKLIGELNKAGLASLPASRRIAFARAAATSIVLLHALASEGEEVFSDFFFVTLMNFRQERLKHLLARRWRNLIET